MKSSDHVKMLKDKGLTEMEATRLALRCEREADPGGAHKDINKKLADLRRDAEMSNRDQIGTEN